MTSRSFRNHGCSGLGINVAACWKGAFTGHHLAVRENRLLNKIGKLSTLRLDRLANLGFVDQASRTCLKRASSTQNLLLQIKTFQICITHKRCNLDFGGVHHSTASQIRWFLLEYN
jgi:hypothetical protein